MLFPSERRVVYRKNPLVEVVCQVRFPTILRIDAEIPVAFQEAIKATFPDYTPMVEQAHNVELTDAEGQASTHISYTTNVNHAFVSADKRWRVNLTSGFIALSTLNYGRWEEFRDTFVGPLEALIRIYEPPYFGRIGLRYTDAIDRVALGLGSYMWSELVKPEMLGMLASVIFPEEDVRQAMQVSELALDDDRTMVINVGIGNVEGDSRPCLIIDTDTFAACSCEATVSNVVTILEGLHEPVSDCFQWAIQPVLRDALGPDTEPFRED